MRNKCMHSHSVPCGIGLCTYIYIHTDNIKEKSPDKAVPLILDISAVAQQPAMHDCMDGGFLAYTYIHIYPQMYCHEEQ